MSIGVTPPNPVRRSSAPDGTCPSHAPVLGWRPWGGTLGTLVLTAPELSIGGLFRAATSGSSLLVKRNSGSGGWEYAPMPLTIDFTQTPITSGHDGCSNDSSPITPTGASGPVVQLDSGGLDGECRTFHATGTL
ncbi:MAG: hypothetical protein IPK07_31400 [Deltaproteobacteria bacterium]|nr:hypothetical protein [Deltaproteobacteria bacterium]